MVESIDRIDKDIFLVLNGQHHPWIDGVMWYSSQMLFWVPVYILLLYAIYRKYGLRNFMMAVICIAVILFVTDFVAVHAVKNTVMRLRPGYDPDLTGKIHFVKDSNGNDYRGGRFGFFSNHASNYSAIVAFYLLIMRPVRTLIVLLLIGWLLLIVYSRIYLGVHYPLDIISGIIYGTTVAWLIHFLFFRLLNKKNSSS